MYKSKNKVQIDFGAPDIYKYYCEKTGNPLKLSQKQFTKITKNFFEVTTDKMMLENFEMVFPKRLGNLRIVKEKYKVKLTPEGDLDKRKLKVDYAATKKMWREEYPDKTMEEIFTIPQKPVIYHQNKHTNGYICKWYWDKRTCMVRNATYYKFSSARAVKRKLAKLLKNTELNLNFYELR